MARGRRVALQEAVPMAVQAERQEAVPVAAVPVAVEKACHQCCRAACDA